MAYYPYVDRRRLDQLAHEGKATFIGAQSDATTSIVNTLVAPGAGQVAIVTRIIGTVTPSASSMATPTANADLALVSPGSAVTHTLSVAVFARSVAFGASTDLRAAPDVPFDWEPDYPLVVPAGWTLTSFTDSTNNSGFSCYGYLISEGDARELGFDVSTTSTQADRRWIQTGLPATNGTQTLIAARTGMSIQILDIYARLQPEQGGTTAKMTLQQSDGDTIMDFINHDRGNTCEWKLSPGIYLESGVGLRLIGNAGAVASSGGERGTVIVIARYVDEDDVPGDAWWSYTVPALPTPAAFTPDTSALARLQNTRMACFYPKSNTSKNEAGKGLHHIVEGYSITAQKTSTSPSTLVYATIVTDSTTPATKGVYSGSAPLSMTPGQAAYPITHTIGFGGTEQCVHSYIDRVNIPLPENQAAWFSGFAVLPTATADVSQWSVTAWGRTAFCTRKADELSRFTGDRT